MIWVPKTFKLLKGAPFAGKVNAMRPSTQDQYFSSITGLAARAGYEPLISSVKFAGDARDWWVAELTDVPSPNIVTFCSENGAGTCAVVCGCRGGRDMSLELAMVCSRIDDPDPSIAACRVFTDLFDDTAFSHGILVSPSPWPAFVELDRQTPGWRCYFLLPISDVERQTALDGGVEEFEATMRQCRRDVFDLRPQAPQDA